MSLAVGSDPTFALDSAVPAELLGTRGLGKQSSVAFDFSDRCDRSRGGSSGRTQMSQPWVPLPGARRGRDHSRCAEGGSAESSEQGGGPRWSPSSVRSVLPTGMGTSDASIKIALHPKLSSLKSVDAASKVTLADQVGSVRSATGSVLNTLSEPTELDRLNQENALWKRKKNQQLKEELGGE